MVETKDHVYAAGTAALKLRQPELVAPAGNWDCVRAAVENGADAIYFGLERHNARLRADNFTEAELPELMQFLHRRGVRGYACFNTLIFSDELEESERILMEIIASGVDAAIVQDIGICRLIRRLSPDFPIHASTQMSITSAAGVEFARELGCQQVVLARECSIRELAKIQEELNGNSPQKIPQLEVFIHGALCVAYSGQCLTSEALGGRSANRGECAQACRLPYDLIVDGKPHPLGDRRYLLSPQDLMGLELLPALVRAGITSIKIEGRMKTPEYVANITHVYRTALDRLARELSANPDKEPELSAKPWRYEMEMAFSRGLYTGWLRGINNQELVHGRFGTKRGVFLGRVSRIHGQRVYIELEGPLKPGDGIVFDAGRPDQHEEGGRVYAVHPASPPQNHKGDTSTREVALEFGHGDVDLKQVHPGDRVWKTSDQELVRRWRRTFQGDGIRYQRPVFMEVSGRVGSKLVLTMRDEHGRCVRAESEMPLASAQNQPLTTGKLREQLGRLGDTPFRLEKLDNQLVGEVILPLSELNRLRRETAAALEKLWAQPPRWKLNANARLPDGNWIESASSNTPAPSQPELIALVRTFEQLDAALDAGIRTIYCDFEDPKKYRDAVNRARSRNHSADNACEIWVAPPRIAKPGEDWVLKLVRSSNADGYLVRNYDHISFFANDRRRGDYTLNVANPIAAEYYIRRHGLERVTASYDLNAAQLAALLRSAPPAWFDITIHQHMPMFHMEHCVFCAFLSKGTDYTNCGRPCEKHDVKIRDRVGMEHPVKADAGCRNTVYNARAQTGAESFQALAALGARHFRVEFVNESHAQASKTLLQYKRLLQGGCTGPELWRELKLLNQLGVTRGQL